MKRTFYLIASLFLVFSCYEFDPTEVDVRNNMKSALGFDIPASQDWSSAYSGEVMILTTPPETEKIRVVAQIKDEEGSYFSILNETTDINRLPLRLTYDAPKGNIGIHVVYITASGSSIFCQVMGNAVSWENQGTRSTTAPLDIELPEGDFYIDSDLDSYASQRGWNRGEILYTSRVVPIPVSDFSDSYKNTFRALVFSYFKNGRAYNNLDLVKQTGFWNESVYPITTGEEPIVISPIYRNDGGYQEIDYADLYYYYFREEDLGDDPVSYLESLPKYRAFPIGSYMTKNDHLEKSVSFALLYWGDGKPEIGKTKGSFMFPPGLKLGFMIRANTTVENKKKQGELYGDGRLNNFVNNYGNFKSSKLGVNGPRMAWLTVNDRMLLCCESGTDTDFNDIIFEVEGGVEELRYVPDLDPIPYFFCYEDRRLGDYDMNDVVLKGVRLNDTSVVYTLMAAGGTDELYIHNIEGSRINASREVHSIFGKPLVIVNAYRGDNIPYVSDTISVRADFSFLDINCQPWIYNKTMGWEVYISQTGQDPHAIVIPYSIRWPLEGICVGRAYPGFNSWGMGSVSSSDWYRHWEEDLVY